MQVKVFEAEDMKAALKMVKETLGPDALILSTRTLRKGALGVFSKPMLEVTAAVDSKPAAAALPPKAAAGLLPATSPVPAAPAAPAPGAAAGEEPNYQDLWKRRKVIDPIEDEVQELKKQLAAQNFDAFREEISDLKALIKEMAGRNQESTRFSRLPSALLPDADPELVLLGAELLRCGIEGEVAEAIIKDARENLSPAQLQDPAVLMAFFRQAVAGMIKVVGPFYADRQGQKRIALVGPTGVGKTTTVAKLAAEFMMNVGSRVALVTIDTYRIAAVEQLKVYGGIMGLPVEVVFAPEQLREAFTRHQDKDLILIDTSGRSPRDESSITELGSFLGPEMGVENHLVLSATTRDAELRETVRRFGRLGPQSLIFTKIDECDQFGALINLPASQKLPLSYLTNGQRVPEDLAVATSPMVTGYVTGQERVATK